MRWYGWQDAIRAGFAADARGYAQLARAAPGLPHRMHGFGYYNVQRFVPHWLIGLVSKATMLDLHLVYWIAATLVLLLIVFLADRLLVRVEPTLGEYAVGIGAIVASPYAFRFIAIAPATVSDGVFAAGVAAITLALLSGRPLLLAAGVLACVLGRPENMLVALPVLVVWLFLGDVWRDRPTWPRVVQAAALAAFVVGTYVVTRRLAISIAPTEVPSFANATILGSLEALPGSARSLGSHVARTLAGLTVPLALLAGALFAGRGMPVPRRAWLCVALGLAVALPSLGLSPAWAAHNEPRLSTLAAVPLVVAAVDLIRSLPPARRAIVNRPAGIGALLLAVGFASLHHRFSIAPLHRAAAFAALELACAVAIVAVLVRARAARETA